MPPDLTSKGAILRVSRVSLDAKVLIAIEAGFPRALAGLQIIMRLGYTPQITPVVLAALWKMAESSDNSVERKLAFETMQGMAGSRYELEEFSDAEKTVVAQHAKILLERRVIPSGNMADARLLVEASYRDGRSALMTRRTPILDANRGPLDVALGDCGMGGSGSLKIFSPEDIIQYENEVLRE
jgi:hypothetical protein